MILLNFFSSEEDIVSVAIALPGFLFLFIPNSLRNELIRTMD